MTNKTLFAFVTAFLVLSGPLVASEVQIVRTLQGTDGTALPGTIAAIANPPQVTVNHHRVEGSFEIAADATRGTLVAAYGTIAENGAQP